MTSLVLSPSRLRREPFVRVLTGDGRRRDPYPLYDQLRAAGPFAPTLLGARVSARHAVCDEVLRSPAVGNGTRSAPQRGQRLIHPLEKPSMIAINPPEHGRQRRLISRAFTSRAIASLRPRVEQLAHELLDRVESRASFDVMTDYAGQLPVLVIAEILGVPTERNTWFRQRGFAVARTLDAGLTFGETTRAATALHELNTYFLDEISARRESPREDVLSALLVPDDAGETLDNDEVLATALLLLVAGFETTVNLIGSGAAVALTDAGARRQLEAGHDESLAYVDEVLRFESPVQFTSRTVLEPVELAGVAFRPGQEIYVALGGANRDPDVFPDPDQFDPTRANVRDHLSFAGGPHFCLGAALARLEGDIALRVLFTRIPHLRLAAPPVRRRSPLLRGYDLLPVERGTAA